MRVVLLSKKIQRGPPYGVMTTFWLGKQDRRVSQLLAGALLPVCLLLPSPGLGQVNLEDEDPVPGLPTWLLIAALQARDSVAPPPEPPPPNPGAYEGFRNVTDISGVELPPGGGSLITDYDVSRFYPNGGASGDFDDDGDVDFFVVQDGLPAFHLYRNDGDLSFTDITDQAGIRRLTAEDGASRGSPAFVDLNADGALDLLVLGLLGAPPLIFINNGEGDFTEYTAPTGLENMAAFYSFSPAFADYDTDGDLDLALGHWGTQLGDSASETETLWRNDSAMGQISFTPVSYQSGISSNINGKDYSFTPIFSDVDLDGDPDLLMAGDFGHSQWFRNLGNGQFSNATDTEVIAVESGMGAAAADIDNDGDMDWFVTAISNGSEHGGNALYINDGNGFTDGTVEASVDNGGWGWGACAMDFDNDGDIDLYHTNGWDDGYGRDASRLFLNDGEGVFSERASALGVADTSQGRGVMCADLDNDGDIDIIQLKKVVGSKNQLDIWENLATSNYFKVTLRGLTPNTGAVGARIEMTAGGKRQFREVQLGSNYVTHNPLIQHFGMGDEDLVDELIVYWPGGGTTVLQDLSINQHLTIEQPAREGVLVSISNGEGSGVYPPGAIIPLNALAPEHGYSFSHWSVVGDATADDAFSANTQLVVPATDLTITANYLPGPSILDPVSPARRWIEVILEAIRKDYARPVVHARNLFHLSAAMYDSWSVAAGAGSTWLAGEARLGENCVLPEVDLAAHTYSQEVAMSAAVSGLLLHRFSQAPGFAAISRDVRVLNEALAKLGLYTDEEGSVGAAQDWGAALAECYVTFGLLDGANEANDYENQAYQPVNPPLDPNQPGNSQLADANRFQPLSLPEFVDQSGNVIESAPEFLGAEWGSVYPFSLTPSDLVEFERGEWTYPVYFDQGPPPTLGSGLDEFYRWGFSMVALWSAHLDTADGVMMDISPASIGNLPSYPNTWDGVRAFYDEMEGGDVGEGWDTNPLTGAPYEPQLVPRGDYTRVLAEFWADGPDSETPPGHWFVIMNTVMDHPLFTRQMEGVGPDLSAIEWDVKAYFALGGAMHDAAIAAWSLKGWYDFIRPISALRAMADAGQSSEPEASDYSVYGLPLIDGRIERVQVGDPLSGDTGEHVGKLKMYAWRGPDEISDPSLEAAGVGWILVENWWPYQRPTFVTPPFAGYVSGHSTYSSAAAVILESLTGDPFFPGGKSEFSITKEQFLVFEKGPSQDVVLEWATYRDAADQCSLSRIWGGIHPPVDDIPGRIIGQEVGARAFDTAKELFESQP